MNTNEEKGVDAEELSRLKQYKNIAKHEDMRRRRTECSVELRKQKRDDLMMKRRNLQMEDDDEVKESSAASGAAPNAKGAGGNARMSLSDVIAVLQNSPTLEQTRDCFESVRRTLSKNKNPPVDEVIQSGLLHALVQALSVEDNKVRFEAAWGLTNIVSGTSEQTMKAVEAGATLPLVALTMHTDPALAEQALWAVANIAGDSAQLRDFVIQCQGVEALLALTDRMDSLTDTFVRTLAWSFSNMCRHKNPHAPLAVLAALSRGLAKLVAHSDKMVKQDSCWALSYLTDGPDEQMQLAVDCGVLPAVFLMLRDSDGLVAPALRVLGNLATGCDKLTQIIVELGTLNEVAAIVERARSSSVIKECCWLMSNIMAGSQLQMQAVIDAQLLPVLIRILDTGDYKCQYEVSWAMANLAAGGTSSQLLELVDEGVLRPLCNILSQKNIEIVTNALETLNALLSTLSTRREEKMGAVRIEVEETGGLDLLEQLQESENEKVYQLAFNIVSKYFSDDDDTAADENQPPGQYDF